MIFDGRGQRTERVISLRATSDSGLATRHWCIHEGYMACCVDPAWRHGWPLQRNLSAVRQSLAGDHRSEATERAASRRTNPGRLGLGHCRFPADRLPPRRVPPVPRTTARWIIQRQSMWITWRPGVNAWLNITLFRPSVAVRELGKIMRLAEVLHSTINDNYASRFLTDDDNISNISVTNIGS